MTTIAKSENEDQYLSPHHEKKQYHPSPDDIINRKARNRRSGSQGSGNFIQLPGASPRISPLRGRKVRIIINYIYML